MMEPVPMPGISYNVLPELLPCEFEALKASIADHGVEIPIIVDQHGNIIDGHHRQRACDELGRYCPREVREFASEADKYELALRANCQRRQLNRSQKRDLIAVYLRSDPEIADNCLAEIIGGVSKNTVGKVRRQLEATCQIDKFKRLRGRDGKGRPAKYRRIIANSQREAETAIRTISHLPDNCAGKTIDILTAKRRSGQNLRRAQRESGIVAPVTIGDIRIHHSRFQQLRIEPGSVALCIADVPYGEAFLPQITELASRLARDLIDGGLLAMYCGVLYLPEVYRRLDEHLTYGWTRAATWDGDANVVHARNVISQWKPIVVYGKGSWGKRGIWPDVSRVNSKEKEWFEWQQPLEEIEELVRYYSNPGDLVLDPVAGSFTTAEACLRQNRRFIGCDCDATRVKDGHERIKRALNGQREF
jgi:hypothetical protein